MHNWTAILWSIIGILQVGGGLIFWPTEANVESAHDLQGVMALRMYSDYSEITTTSHVTQWVDKVL